MVNTRNLSIIPSLNCREWKYKDANFCIYSFPISSSNISPYHSPSCYSSSFLNASISLISIHLMFNCLALSFFHILSSPSSDPIPISFSPNILLPMRCPSVSGEGAQMSVLAFNPHTWQHRVTRLHDVLLRLLMSKSPLNPLKTKMGKFFLNLYWTSANIFWMVYILANYKQCLFWQIMSYQKLKRQLVKERI